MIRAVIFVTLFMVALFWVSAMDALDEARDRQHYCEMTNLWLSQTDKEPGMRDGWPPFNGVCR